MPTYDYECRDCNNVHLDVFHKLDDPGPVCDLCSEAMRRRLGTPASLLRGGGWAADGYASTPKDSIPAVDMHEGMMRAAQEGTKAGGEKEGIRRTLQFQKSMETKYGGH